MCKPTIRPSRCGAKVATMPTIVETPSEPPRKIHIATAGYLRLFGAESMVAVRDVASGTEKLEGVTGVAWRPSWWSDAPGVAEAVEASLSRCEDQALRTMQQIDSLWPLENAKRAALAEFVALHAVRGPSFRTLLHATAEEAIADVRSRHELSAERIGSLLMCMRWDLVRFDDDLLTTSDQPVVCMPFLAPGRQPNPAAVPPFGYMNSMEIAFPVNPRRLLLATWADGDDAILAGTLQQACSANCSVTGQADAEWFFKPGTFAPRRSPPLLEKRALPIAPQLIPGYTAQGAAASARCRSAEQLMNEMIQSNAARDRLRWIVPPADERL